MAEPVIRLAGADAERCRRAMAALEPAIAAAADEFGETTLLHALCNCYVARSVRRAGSVQAALTLVNAARGLIQREDADG
jgi:hypothetical protein